MIRFAWIAAGATFLFHLAANPHYGFFRDELYFIMCGFRPDWGYVDQPPLVPLLAALTQLAGHSLVLLRAVPALFAAAAVFVAIALAAELRGGAFARVLTAIVVALSPVLASFGGKVGTDEGLPFLWTLAAYAVLCVVRGADPRWWLVAGAALGIGLEMKYSTVFFGAALVAAVLVLPERRALASRWFRGALALCVLIALPSALWQAAHGLPMLELLRNGQHGKNVVVSPLAFLGQELLITGVLFWPVWLAGLVFLAREPSTRFLALAWVLLIGAMIALHGKHYYPAAVYPIPFAAGCVALEAWTARARLLRPVLVAALLAGGLVFVPFALPVLPEQTYLGYEASVMRALHVSRGATSTEHHAESALPSDFADMHGWPELAATVERVVAGLRPGERERAVIVAGNYGEAAALEFFGRDLPPVASGHNQYFLWGPHGRSGDVLIDVGGDCGAHDRLYAHAERAATAGTPYAIAYERDLPIMVCRGPRVPLPVLWPRLKEYI
ncbi:MAG TPA: glycosyltransferase family 39 protein [Candidatus Elarobacter sp.]|nr:glycosyltransferase family 39 protein [Candidatus Elarobacter sp.]